MKLITWNIQWGLGIDGVFSLTRIVDHARQLADFDVLCLQEVADNFPQLEGSAGENQFAVLASLLPGFTLIEGPAVDVPDGQGGRRRFGNALLSRLPVGQVFRHTLAWEAAEARSMPRLMIDAMIEAPIGPVRVMTTHLEYSHTVLRAAQVESVRAAHRQAAERVKRPPLEGGIMPFAPQPVTASAILCGDFNMKPSDPSKARLEAPFEDGAPALVDLWAAMHPGEPHPPSFCLYDQTYGPAHCCDFVFATGDVAARLTSIDYDLATKASDHQPVVVTF
ncbi:MAG: endonuclease/exonuclease/phosphatase family protein [Phreatobacter sp.]